jgi:hypothetical protein
MLQFLYFSFDRLPDTQLFILVNALPVLVKLFADTHKNKKIHPEQDGLIF